jgi:ABC-type Fe3+-hydroxamate transport system substrate-binding protein
MQKRLSIVLVIVLGWILWSPVQLNASTPKRIISLAPSLTKNLTLLEADDLLVGCTNYCTFPDEIHPQIVANAVQVNFEKIVLLQPDLIITTNLTRPRTIETIKKLGIKLLLFENPEDFEAICEQFISLGKVIGKEKKALAIVEESKHRIAEVQKLIPQNRKQKEKVFMQLGSKPLFTVVPGSFMNDYLRLSSTQNLAGDLKIGSINQESVLTRNPDVIIIVLMGMVGEEEKKKWQQFSQMTAVEKGRIYMLDADKACSPTPLTFVESLEAVIRMVYLDEKQKLN